MKKNRCMRRAHPKYDESWVARNAQVTNKYGISVEIKQAYRVRSRDYQMNITLVITESMREENCEMCWYLGCVRRAQPKYNESWAARNAQVTNKNPYFCRN